MDALRVTSDPGHPLVADATATLGRAGRDAVATARRTLHDRQLHVSRGNQLAAQAADAAAEHLAVAARLRAQVTRPEWLHPRVHWLTKILLLSAEVGAGTAALYVAGDPWPLALLTFTGVAIATVLAGSNVGTQVRRREQGEPGGLIGLAVLTVVLATVLLGLYRYLTLGPTLGVLGGVTALVALGSAFASYLWHDSAADQIERTRRQATKLERASARQHHHPTVRRFEKAEAEIRPALAASLHAAYLRATAPRSVFDPAPGGEPAAVSCPGDDRSAVAPVVSAAVTPPGIAELEMALSALMGPEILALVPKTCLGDRR